MLLGNPWRGIIPAIVPARKPTAVKPYESSHVQRLGIPNRRRERAAALHLARIA